MELVIFPDQILKSESKEVENIDDKIIKFTNDMVHSMYEEGGIGLAAVQVGSLLRILTMDITGSEEKCGMHDKIYHVINPKILSFSEETCEYDEGCLSFPEQRTMIIRPKMIELEYFDQKGKIHKCELDGIAARCIQHEMDHLNGITIADRVSAIKKQMIIEKAKSIKKKRNKK
jgi:peptide deformylase